MAAVLACGSRAVLSHRSAAALWEILSEERELVEVSVPARLKRRQPGIVAHRRIALAWDEVRRHHGIPVTTPIDTLIDIAPGLRGAQLERAVNEADRLGLVDVEALRTVLAGVAPRPGVRTLRELLDFRTFTVTESELERRFLPLARKAGLPKPRTGCIVNGFKVDFFWPELGLVVETDGLRYHRTPSQQARDHLRNQAHAAAGLTPLRFTHAQVWFEPDYVVRVLSAVAGRLTRSMAGR